MGDFFSVAGQSSEYWKLLLFIVSSQSSQDCSPRLAFIQSLQWICKGDAIKKDFKPPDQIQTLDLMNWGRKKSQFLSQRKNKPVRACHAHNTTAVPAKPTLRLHLPRPSLNEIQNQFSLCLPGAVQACGDIEAYPTWNKQMHCTWETFIKKERKENTFIRNPFPPENIDPRENHFQFASHECKYFPNFCLGCGAGVDWLFLWDWEEHLLPRLRGNEMLTAANTCLSFFGEIIAPWKFTFQNFEITLWHFLILQF